MKVDIKDIIMYSSWEDEYNDENESCIWLEPDSRQYFSSEDLINDFGYSDKNDIYNSGWFVQLPMIKQSELKREFISSINQTEIEKAIKLIMDNNNNGYLPGYSVAFNIFLEEHPKIEEQWNSYYNDTMMVYAKKWCKENEIDYYKPFDSERVLNIKEVYKINMYNSEDPLNDAKTPPTVFFRLNMENFTIIDDELTDFFNCSDNEAVDNSNFILLPMVDIIEIEKKFMIINNLSIQVFNTSDCEKYGFDYVFCNTVYNMNLSEKWHEFLDNELLNIYISWCEKNHILYYIPTGIPIHKKLIKVLNPESKQNISLVKYV